MKAGLPLSVSFIVASFITTALLAGTVTAQPDLSMSKKVKVGALLTLSGKFASAGEDCRLGIEAGLAVAGLNAPIEITYADTLNDPTTAVSEFRRLVTREHIFAAYTHRSSMGMALNPISLKTGIPLLGAVAHKDFATNNTFALQVAWRTDVEGESAATELVKRGDKKVALIFTEDEYTSADAESFRKKLREFSGSLVFESAVLPAETDFRSLLLQLKGKAPTAIYLDVLLPHIVPLIKQIQEVGIEAGIFGNFYIAKEEVTNALGSKALEGMQFLDVQNDLPALKARLSGGRAINPPGLTLTSYLATLLLAQTAKENPRVATTAEFAAALLRQSAVVTPDRIFRIENRIVQIPLVVKRFQDGRIVAD